MAEKNEESGRKNQKKSGSKRSRRRYYRKDGEKKDKRNSSQQKRKRDDDNQRRARRNRRRRRSGGGGESGKQEKVAPVIAAIESDYVAPTSFYAYTHIVRSQDVRDSYEYRHERLTGGGRTLEDFRIDLSSLFAEDGETLKPLGVFNAEAFYATEENDEENDEEGDEDEEGGDNGRADQETTADDGDAA